MASNPKLQKLIAFVDAHHGGRDALLEQLASGKTGVALARMIQASLTAQGIALEAVACSPDSVRLMLKRYDEPRYREALAAGAQTLMEESLEIADGVPAERDAIQKARLQTDIRKHHASKMDPTTWGDTTPGVQINLGHEFLRAVANPSARRPPPREIVVEAAEPPKQLPATTAEKIMAEQRDAARLRETTEEIGKLGYGPQEATRLAVRLIRAEDRSRPAVSETIPGFKHVQVVKENADD